MHLNPKISLNYFQHIFFFQIHKVSFHKVTTIVDSRPLKGSHPSILDIQHSLAIDQIFTIILVHQLNIRF